MRKKSKLKIYEYQVSYKKYYEDGCGIREIARYLGRSPSTISRLLRRNIHPCPGMWRRMTTFEKWTYAWEKSRKTASKSRQRIRLKTPRIRNLVCYLLGRKRWSPESISKFLKLHGIYISSVAIYQFIKNARPLLVECLRLRGKPRRQRVVRRRGLLTGAPAKKSIHERPERIGSGHWEIDAVLSKQGSKAAVVSLREHHSKQRFYFLVSDLKSSTVMRVLFPFFNALPAHMCKTLTADNGSEFSQLHKLEDTRIGLQVYYCEPYKAWQRGSIEHANGELRWYFPKKTDFASVSEQELRHAQYQLNAKPMKLHGYRSSSKIFHQLLAQAV